MKRLPQKKQNQLIGVLIGTAAFIIGIYFFLISPLKDSIASLERQTNEKREKLGEQQKAIGQVKETDDNLKAAQLKLTTAEQDMAFGDVNAWTFETMRRVKADYRKVDIETVSQPGLGDCDLVPNLPYKQIRFIVSGTAFYHDLGRFIADFENKFPHCRVVNLDAVPNGNAERLNFRMDMIVLVKSNN